jgi:hypothetical protein
MSNRCSSSRSMSSNRCDGLSVSNLSTRKVVAMAAAWLVAQPHGRECMMMFRSPMLVGMAMVEDGVDSKAEKEVEATEDQPHLRLDLKVRRRRMLQLDQRMLGSQVRTTAVVAEVVNVVSTHMREDEWLGARPFREDECLGEPLRLGDGHKTMDNAA